METSEIEILSSKIEAFPGEYLPIKQQAKKYLKNDSTLDKNSTLNIFRRPWVAPFNWGLILYKGAEAYWIEQFEQNTQKIIPSIYKSFLQRFNGCFIYDLSLFGLTPTIYLKGTLDRTLLQCHDLITANIEWILEYKLDQHHFYFGSRAYSFDENIGYFFVENKIRAIRTNGKIEKEWFDFTEFLNDEIKEAEKMMLKEIPKGVKILAEP